MLRRSARLKAIADAKERVPERVINDDIDTAPECRLCYGGEEEGRLFHPCLCDGSQRYIHETCLDQWRLTSAGTTQCPTCKFPYTFARMRLANVLMHPITTLACTVLTITVFVWYIVRNLVVAILGTEKWQYVFDLATSLVSRAVFVIVSLLFLLSVLECVERMRRVVKTYMTVFLIRIGNRIVGVGPPAEAAAAAAL